MSASKNRLRWHEVPKNVRLKVEQVIDGRVIAAQNCPDGFSRGLASRLTLADGRRIFVKAINADSWPNQAITHRIEARIAAALPATVSAPQLLASFEDDQWVVLLFEDIDGNAPLYPWSPSELNPVLDAISQLAQATPLPSSVFSLAHLRLGGWSELASDSSRLARLLAVSAWAAHNIDRLIKLEQNGLVAVQGDSLIHCDLYPHNILLTPQRVVFVDWAHARLGAPVLDVILVLTSAAADGIDPEPFLYDHRVQFGFDSDTINAVLAAHAGFLVNSGLLPVGTKEGRLRELRLGNAGVDWLRRRLDEV